MFVVSSEFTSVGSWNKYAKHSFTYPNAATNNVNDIG